MGDCDTKIEVYDSYKGNLIYEDDNSGIGKNALINTNLSDNNYLRVIPKNNDFTDCTLYVGYQKETFLELEDGMECTVSYPCGYNNPHCTLYFTPDKDCTATIYSTGKYNTNCILYDHYYSGQDSFSNGVTYYFTNLEDGTYLATDTDSYDNLKNFSLSYLLKAGKTYYYRVGISGESEGVINVHFTCDYSNVPSYSPSTSPSVSPSASPSTKPDDDPSASPSTNPSDTPSASPSTKPSDTPSASPSTNPSTSQSTLPSTNPNKTMEPVTPTTNNGETTTPDSTVTTTYTSSTPTPEVPNRIISFEAQDDTHEKAVLEWHLLTPGEEVNIYRSETTPEDYNYLATTTGNVYYDKTAKPGKKYYYKIMISGSDSTPAISVLRLKLAKPVANLNLKKSTTGLRYLQFNIKKWSGKYIKIYVKYGKKINITR
jgi:hypothetical protein